MEVYNLKTDYREKPLGIDALAPRFSWNVKTNEKNWKQESYRLMMAECYEDVKEEKNLLWDTGPVQSDLMGNVPYEGKGLSSDTRYYWKVLLKKKGNSQYISSEITYFETGLIKETDWHGKWIGETKDHTYHIFRKTFRIKKEIQKAKLYVCGLGHFEFYINGRKTDDSVLEPGWTNYNKSCFYTVLDVTDLLFEGENAAGVFLGDGMFHVPGGRYVYFERSYGKCKLLVQLNITYNDGTREEIITDESWLMASSPLTFSCIYGGEDYDGRLQIDDFSSAACNADEVFNPVVIVEPPSGKLISQPVPPIKVKEIYKPVTISEIKEGIYLYDFGKNFSGWVRMQLQTNQNAEGKRITLTPGELLNSEKEPDQRVTGRGYHWQYTLNKKEKQSYAPKFTYTGFRYVMVEGAVPKEFTALHQDLPVIESLSGEFLYPDVEAAGEFHCSNELFNQIHEIVLQAMKSNLKSILTDCPHREKLGWLEQTHLIGPALLFNFELHNLYEKIEMDMKDAQHENGLIPDICPEYVVFGYHEGFVDSPEWGSASIINPWYIYKLYGDAGLLEKYYDVMKKYLEYLTSRTHHSILHHGLGDWLDIGPNTPYSQNTPVPIIASAIYYYDIRIMHQTAKLLNQVEDELYFKTLMEEVYREYNSQFYDKQTCRYGTGSQAAQAMSLVAGLTDKETEEKVLEYLVKDIKVRGFATTAGDIGHPFVLAALTMYGKSDIINEMTNITDKPGYGYQVINGATTLTEEWDGPDPKHPHGSQNHFMLGSIEEWFYSGLAGINRVRKEGRMDEIVIKPHFAKGCNQVSAWTLHPYGKIAVHWEKREKDIFVAIEIPPNTKAEFINELNESKCSLGSGKYQLYLQHSNEQER